MRVLTKMALPVCGSECHDLSNDVFTKVHHVISPALTWCALVVDYGASIAGPLNDQTLSLRVLFLHPQVRFDRMVDWEDATLPERILAVQLNLRLLWTTMVSR